MRLLVVYIVLVVIGDVLAYAIGRGVEYLSSAASLPVFLACFFIAFWGAWKLAIRIA